MARQRLKKVGILTGGGDCPGLNAVIRAVAKTAINDYGASVIGFKDGYFGLMRRVTQPLGSEDVSGILTRGGTILGTSNIANPFRFSVERKGKLIFRDVSDEAVNTVRRSGIDVLFVVGGDGTLSIAHRLSKKGINVVGIPKTIDNDVCGTDFTFGFISACATAAECIDKLHSTAQSHHRVMIIEVMGRYAGWLTLYAGVAGGGDIILIPEIPFSIDNICKTVTGRNKRGKRFSIVVVAEGAKAIGGQLIVKRIVKKSTDAIRLGGIAKVLVGKIEKRTGIETRATILGHLQRGGSPSPFDRVLATRFGSEAVHLAANKGFGKMVALKGQRITSVPLNEVVDKQKLVPQDHPLIKTAISVGTSFGI